MTILLLDQTQILDPRIKSVLSNYSLDWNSTKALAQFNPNMWGYTVRCGKNTLPFDNLIVDQLDFKLPSFDKNFKHSIGEITDRRCQQLWQTRYDRPWLVFWSGGIDSTTVLVSILKNIPAADRSRIHVACNKISVYENPRFYYDHITPNFVTVDSTFLSLTEKLLTDYYIITGDLSDQLFTGSAALGLQQTNIDTFDRDLMQEPEQLLDYVDLTMKNRSATEWFYQKMVNNIQSVDIPITTHYDFFWWFFFNWMWTGVKIRPVCTGTYTPELMKLYLKNYIAWFEDVEYQHWAIHNNCVERNYGNHIGEYKLELKKYIHEYNHDDYYFTFKTKGGSVGRLPESLNWFCILDDFSVLTLDDNLEQIIKLLPAHIV